MRRVGCAIVIAGLVFGVCGAEEAPNAEPTAVSKAKPVRVVSFNLYHGGVTSARWGDGDLLEQRLRMVMTQLGQIGADVIGLQESSVGRDRGDIAARIAGELGFREVRAEARYSSMAWLVHWALGFEEGPAVLSRFPIVSSEAIPLAGCGLGYRRAAVCARVAAPSGPIDVCSAHTSSSVCEHRSLAAALLRRDASVPLVLTGDLNAPPDARGIRGLVRKVGLVDAFAAANPGAPGFTVWQNPRESRPTARRRVDYVFARPAADGTLRVAASWVVLRTPGRGPDLRMVWPSDHYGVLADLVFAPAR